MWPHRKSELGSRGAFPEICNTCGMLILAVVKKARGYTCNLVALLEEKIYCSWSHASLPCGSSGENEGFLNTAEEAVMEEWHCVSFSRWKM